VTATTYPNSKAAAERYFRLYYQHCVEPNPDTLFSLLDAAHSLNDKLSKELKVDIYSCNEYASLQALRNLFHHEAELTHEVRVLPVSEIPTISSDLLAVCLVRRTLVERAIEKIPLKRRKTDRDVIEQTLSWYGDIVNINPCRFNFTGRVFEEIKKRSH